jgi:shikimate kinase
MQVVDVRRIYLVGFMGSGKSTVGRELSARLGWRFVDLDAEIEAAEGVAVREIFERLGEPRFRQLEREHLDRVSGLDRVVVALGGGAYADPENRRRVNATGVAVWLNASLRRVRDRIRPDGKRPLFQDPERAKRLYLERLPSYKLARIHVLVDNRLPDALADEIVGKVAKL